jgi:hypothetical protein
MGRSASIIGSASFFAIFGLVASLSGCSRHTSARYTEDDVRNFVLPGTSREAIIQRFGEPVIVEKNPKFEDGNTNVDEIILFRLPPSPPGTKEDYVFAGFQVGLKNGKVVDWISTHRSSN